MRMGSGSRAISGEANHGGVPCGKLTDGLTTVGGSISVRGKKPTVYLDTTIISSYWYEGTDVLALGRRLSTREWWEAERTQFVI